MQILLISHRGDVDANLTAGKDGKLAVTCPDCNEVIGGAEVAGCAAGNVSGIADGGEMGVIDSSYVDIMGRSNRGSKWVRSCNDWVGNSV